MDPGEQADEVVLLAEREDGVDQVVADAGLALLDLEAVGEEGRQRVVGELNPLPVPNQLLLATIYDDELLG